MFPRRGFTTWKHQCVDIWSGYVSGYWRCSSSAWILVFSNMVLEPVWRPAPVVDRDREAKLPHIHFLSLWYIYGQIGLFHCVWSAHFIQEHFSFHSKRFMFAQDTTITVRFGGIKLEYTFCLNFCRVVFWFYFGFVLFIYVFLLF